MQPIDYFRRIKGLCREGNPEMREFPSGAIMLDINIGPDRFCAEYLPSHRAFGLSKVKGASPFWEGVDESFSSAEDLEARILDLIRQSGRK